MNSIRISDHPGKKHLSYKYNIGSNTQRFEKIIDQKGYMRLYFPVSDIEKLVSMILQKRDSTIRWLGLPEYIRSIKNQIKEHASDTTGFWSKAREINRRK